MSRAGRILNSADKGNWSSALWVELFVDEAAGVVVEDVAHVVLVEVGVDDASNGHEGVEPGVVGAEEDFLGAGVAAHPLD